MQKILFICDPLQSFKIATDTTYSLMIAAAELNHEIYYCNPGDLYTETNDVFINVAIKLDILASSKEDPGVIMPWFKENDSLNNQALTTFTLVMVRNDPPFNLEYYYLTQILTLAEKSGVLVVNNSFMLRNYNEKLAILNFPQLITPTIVSKNKNVLLTFLAKHNDCVIKPLDLMAGRGIFKISLTDVNCDTILENSTKYYTETVMLQKFIPEVISGDRRIFIVHGQVIEYCLYRIPQQNRFRGNIAAGGRGEVHHLKPEDYLVANPVAKWLAENNIAFSGIDVIGDKLTEINITSPTGTRQILKETGLDIPKLLLAKY